MPSVDIHDEPDRLVAVVSHKGAYAGLEQAMKKATEIMSTCGRRSDVAESVGIFHDNPEHVAQENLRSHAGFVMKDGCHVPEGFEALHLEGGRYAVCAHAGPYAGLQETYGWLLNTWLPQSKEEFGGGTLFEVYVNSPGEVEESRLQTRIYIPLEDEDFNGPL